MSGFVEEMARKRAVDVQEQKKIQQQKHEAAIENHQIKMVESFKNSVVYKEFPKETLWEMEFDSPGAAPRAAAGWWDLILLVVT